MERSSSYVTDEEGNMGRKDIHKMVQVIFFEDYLAAEILKVIVGSLFFRLPSLYEEDVLDVYISRSAVF